MRRLSFIVSRTSNFRSRVYRCIHDKGVSNDDDEYHAYVTPIPRSILRLKCSINCLRVRFQSSLRGLLNEIILRRPFTHRDSHPLRRMRISCKQQDLAIHRCSHNKARSMNNKRFFSLY